MSLIIFIGLILTIVVAKFIYDTYLSDNTKKPSEEYKEKDFVVPSKIENYTEINQFIDTSITAEQGYYETNDIDLSKKGLSEDWLSILTASAFENASSESKKSFIMVLLLSINLQKLTNQSKAANIIHVLSVMLKQNTGNIVTHLLGNLQLDEVGKEIESMSDSQKKCLIYGVNLLLHTDTADSYTYAFSILSMGGVTEDDYYSVIQSYRSI